MDGPTPYALSLAEVEALAAYEARLPITCVEGWSVNARWRGLRLLDVVQRAGGTADSRVQFHSVETEGYNHSEMFGPQVSEAVLATHLNGERLNLDHGYPAAADRPEPARRAQHQVARPDRGAVMGRWRIVLAVAGIALGLFGVGRLVTQIPVPSLIGLAVWLIAALVIHDGIVSPLVLAVGRARRPGAAPRPSLPAGRADHGGHGHGARRPDDLPARQPARRARPCSTRTSAAT